MACYNCGSINTEKPELVRYFQWAGKNPFFVDNVPATVCRVCGPTGYMGKVLSIIDRAEEGKIPPASTQMVRVFDLRNPLARNDGKGDRLKPMKPAIR